MSHVSTSLALSLSLMIVSSTAIDPKTNKLPHVNSPVMGSWPGEPDGFMSSDDDTELMSSSDFDDVDLSDTRWPELEEFRPFVKSEKQQQVQPDNQQQAVQQLGAVVSEEEHSQPLKTLKKLQQMLDETDYMTTSRSEEQKPPPPSSHQATTATTERSPPPPLLPQAPPWTSQVQTPPRLPFPTLPQQKESQVSHQQQQAPPQPPAPPQRPAPPLQQQPPQRQRVTPQRQISPQQQQHVQQLWTSKDRSKYKKIQQMQRRAEEERRRLLMQQQQQHGAASSDDEEGAETDGPDDGLLSYSLPNLPVYMSDAEGEGSDPGEIMPTHQTPLQQTSPPTNRLEPGLYTQQQQSPYQYPPPSYGVPPPPPDQQQQQMGAYPYPPPGNGYPPPPYPPFGSYPSNPQQQLAAQYAAAWAAAYGYPPPPTTTAFQPNPSMTHLPKPALHFNNINARSASKVPLAPTDTETKIGGMQTSPMEMNNPYYNTAAAALVVPVQPPQEIPTTLAEASSRISFDSIQKISILMTSVALLSYCAVSPRNLPVIQYNVQFYENVRIVMLATIAPVLNFLMVCDARENDVNSVTTSFYTAFLAGYGLAFVLEILLATVIRLGVFSIWERGIFQLTPKVPSLILPWVLRDKGYRPKRITLFTADFLTSCVASPVVEEYLKLRILELCVKLPKNFQWHTKETTTTSKNGKKRKRKRRVVEPAPKSPGEAAEVTNINGYVTHMLAVSLGLKLCDSMRRILMYTKVSQPNKSFYAICRGLFPIHELCGTMTALALAKRDVLGVDVAQWRILFPAVLIHGMANFRGMKPIFKWNSASPWSEMQLSPWNVADDSTLPQLVNKGFAKLMWLIILGRVLGFCIKNYYLVSRQARKRITTYAGKHSAFSAQLAAAEALKKSKKDKTK